ncbi:hypothetical protein EC991_000061 [Linnemannia zychae]|nr:hypothetical protein EC991_000061 [Linnemannia zychae]
MDLPHQHRYQDHSSAKVFFESCLDTFESIPTAPTPQQYPSPSASSSSSISSSDTLVNPQQQHNDIDHNNKHNSLSTMDRNSNNNNNQPPTPAAELTSSSSAGPIDFSGPYGPVSATANMPLAPMAPVYPLLAQALEREGFPGLASMLAYTHDQHQLEQVTVQSALEHQYSMSSSSAGYHHDQQDNHHSQVHPLQQQQHQQQQPLQDDTYLLDFVMAQNAYNPAPSTSSSAPYAQEQQALLINNTQTDAGNTDPALQDPNNPYNLMSDMAPLEVMQYNSLLLDGQLLDVLRYSVNTPGSGGCGDGMDPTTWCDAPQAFGMGPNGIYLGDQFSHIIQPSQQQGYFNPSMPSSSGSSSAGSSSTAGTSSSANHFGFNWAGAAGLYQNDYLMDRKREGAGMSGQAMMPGAVVAPRVAVQEPFESAEAPESDDEDDDADSADEDNSYPADDNIVPALSLPKRNSRRASQGLKHERDMGESQYQHHQYQHQQTNQHYQHQAQHQHQQGHLSHSHYSHHNQHGQYHQHSNSMGSSSSSISHPQQSYEHQGASSFKRARMDSLTVGSASAGQRRSSATHSPGHSRNSSTSSVHSLLSSMEQHNVFDASGSKAGSSIIKGSSPSSSGSSASSSKFTRPQSDTIEKRMHPCTFEGCDKSFTRAFNLRSHVNTHNGERPHKCPEPGCDWDFVRRHDLDRHVKSKHLANKPYACNLCTSRFGRSDALQRHRRLENHF